MGMSADIDAHTPNANWTDPRMKCPGTVFAAYHNGCKLEPWHDLCCGNRFHNTLARPWRHRWIRLQPFALLQQPVPASRAQPLDMCYYNRDVFNLRLCLLGGLWLFKLFAPLHGSFVDCKCKLAHLQQLERNCSSSPGDRL